MNTLSSKWNILQMPIDYAFCPEKNNKLKNERDIDFNDIIYHIHRGGLLDIVCHHNTKKYPGQQFLIVDVHGYIYMVPFVQNNNIIFLKTIFPSRKQTKKYKSEKQQ